MMINNHKIFSPNIHGDSRGFFTEAFKYGSLENVWIQDNVSLTEKKGTVRGMHLQKGQMAQAKLVSVRRGKIIDVIIDLRKNSENYLKVFEFILDDKECKSLYIPRGYAHGFQALEDNTVVEYKVDNFYSSGDEVTILYSDIKKEWPLLISDLSKKDEAGILLKEFLHEK